MWMCRMIGIESIESRLLDNTRIPHLIFIRRSDDLFKFEGDNRPNPIFVSPHQGPISLDRCPSFYETNRKLPNNIC